MECGFISSNGIGWLGVRRDVEYGFISARNPSCTVIRMGLNASRLKKDKGGGKKKGGAGSSAAAPGGKKTPAKSPPTGNSVLDTERREFIYQMYRLTKRLPNGKEILKGINLAFYPGAKIGVLGNNGSGKSTLLRIMAGADDEFDGESRPQNGIRIGYLPQEPTLDNGETVRENIEWAVREIRENLRRFGELSEKLSDESLSPDEQERVGGELSRVQDAIEAQNGWELDRIVDRAIDALRCPSGDAETKHLSGGERRRVALAALLLRRPELLLLDEPTNHLDALSVAWLETFLDTFPHTVVTITHDRYFNDNVAKWILELDRGAGIPFEGNYSQWLEAKSKRLAQEKKEESERRRFLEQELEWIRQNPKGRQVKQKARLSRYEDLQREEEAASKNTSMNQIFIPTAGYLGEQVIDAEGLRKGFGERMLFDDLSFSIPRGAIVGVIGGNGSGKSTLFRIITGNETADAGQLTIGETVKLMYVDQNRESLSGEKTVWEEISDGYETLTLGNREVSSRAYLSWFNFRGADQQKKVSNLSGGERNRLNLAKVLLTPGNVLLLDEPTNDLDVPTLQNLEHAILNFSGCTLVASHDRFFLDKICTHILAFEGESRVTFFTGNFHSYEEDRKVRLGDAEPTRVKFRPMPVA
uniref:Probable ATP-dependent transporter ycf16 n=1 Tax=Compsopogon caeruleus TaxID=31354 RepID=A0A7S1TJA0_9RHOD